MRKIIDNDRQAKEVSNKLIQAQTEEVNFFDHNLGIRTDAKLKVHIVDAVNLPENSTTFVKVIQDGASSQTNQRTGGGPIWNEAIVFDIYDPTQPVEVQLLDSRGRV